MVDDKKINKGDIIKYLKVIDSELRKRNVKGEILISGGASMCLVHDARESTKDIDAMYEPKNTINEIASSIAIDKGLGKDWINDGVKGFLHKNMPKETVFEFENLTVNTVSAESLLAMKLVALREHTKDYDDAEFLIRKLGIKKDEELLGVMEKFTHPNNLNVIIQYKALDWLGHINDKRKLEQKEKKNDINNELER